MEAMILDWPEALHHSSDFAYGKVHVKLEEIEDWEENVDENFQQEEDEGY